MTAGRAPHIFVFPFTLALLASCDRQPTCQLAETACFDEHTLSVCALDETVQQLACQGATPICRDGACVECTIGQTRPCGNCAGGLQACQADLKWGACEGEPSAPQTWYRDGDGDGFGVAEDAISSCDESLPGHALEAGDCCDEDERVRPGAAFAATPDAGCSRGWDFDCDGVTTKEHLHSYAVTECGMYSCSSDPGWQANSIPECGVAKPFVAACRPMPCDVCSCEFPATVVTQRCR